MALALQISKHMLRKGAFPAFSQLNACRTLVCSSNNLAKLGTGMSTEHSYADSRQNGIVSHQPNICIHVAPQPNVTGMMLPSTHWTIERVVAISMLPMYPIALMLEPYGSEYIVAAAVSLHAYWGFNGVIRDYIMERRYGPTLQPVLQMIWKVFCAAGFAGFCYFNYYDVGIIKGVKKLWHF
ncbi:unnamed protein product [Dibothriocephalus latus]|uniref:Succinate dehydrogenase [ubiquinone] cytochrome b small subunit n=1 Tax=Dibothriocephalus latus TaxID=60516 RepID=A0A3P7NJ44_DIBLA|nr:unnamed protein product [Dibothriocephalus latus]